MGFLDSLLGSDKPKVSLGPTTYERAPEQIRDLYNNRFFPSLGQTFDDFGGNQVQEAALQRMAAGPGATGDISAARRQILGMGPVQNYGFMGTAAKFGGDARAFLRGAVPFFSQSRAMTNQGTQRLDDAQFGRGLTRYMNPYVDNVINAGVNDILQGAERTRETIGENASSVGAYGSDREGAMLGVLGGEVADAIGRLSAGERRNAYTQAVGNTLGQFNQEQGRYMQGAGIASNNARGMLSGAGVAGNLASTFGNLARANEAQALGRANALLGLRRATMDDYYTQANNQLLAGNMRQQMPINRLNFLGNALRTMFPYDNPQQQYQERGMLQKAAGPVGTFFGGMRGLGGI